MVDVFHVIIEIAMWLCIAWVAAYACIFLYALIVGPSNEPNPPSDYVEPLPDREEWEWNNE